ncbi:hypothetical protein ACLKA7_000952 [Drosophila subpalustris]
MGMQICYLKLGHSWLLFQLQILESGSHLGQHQRQQQLSRQQHLRRQQQQHQRLQQRQQAINPYCNSYGNGGAASWRLCDAQRAASGAACCQIQNPLLDEQRQCQWKWQESQKQLMQQQ